jgi:hypothetical protein
MDGNGVTFVVVRCSVYGGIMRVAAVNPSKRRRYLLLGALVLALFVTLFFGTRAFRRLIGPPRDEPIRGWMNIPYIAHSYRIPPDRLLQALDLPNEKPPTKKPIDRIARDLNLSTDEVIKRLEEAIAQERSLQPPPDGPAPTGPLDQTPTVTP